MRVLQTGFFTEEETAYRQAPALGSTEFGKFLISPAHYAEFKSKPMEETDALRLGRAFHEVLLLGRALAVAPDVDRRTAAGKAAYADFVESSKDKTMVKPEERDQINGMVASIRAHKGIAKLIANGIPEQSVYAYDPKFGIWLKCRPDLRVVSSEFGHVSVDIKTSKDSVKPDSFSQTMKKYNMHVQAAFYNRVLRLAGADTSSLLAPVEKTSPYSSMLYRVGKRTSLLTDQLVERHLEYFAECQRAKTWPGYPEDCLEIDLPAWAESQLESELLE